MNDVDVKDIPSFHTTLGRGHSNLNVYDTMVRNNHTMATKNWIFTFGQNRQANTPGRLSVSELGYLAAGDLCMCLATL